MIYLRFYYVNHRNEGHVYVVDPYKVFLAGSDHMHSEHLVIRGQVIEKDGEKVLLERDFIICKMQSMTEVTRDDKA